jgi:hypothetical protein
MRGAESELPADVRQIFLEMISASGPVSACRSCRITEGIVGCAPHAADGRLCIQKNSCRSQGDEANQESILDQVLALFVSQETK